MPDARYMNSFIEPHVSSGVNPDLAWCVIEDPREWEFDVREYRRSLLRLYFYV